MILPAIRLALFAALLSGALWAMNPAKVDWLGVVASVIVAGFLAFLIVAAGSGFLSKPRPLARPIQSGEPPIKRGRQWPWFAVQISIVAGFLWLAYVQQIETGQPPNIGGFLILGVVAACVVTGLASLLGRAVAALRTRIGVNEASRQRRGRIATGAGSDGPQPSPRARVGQHHGKAI